jgi:predicted TIM-barrel fold metal-dependent hydrolase
MSALWDRVRQGLPVTDIEIIDLHGHIGRCNFATPELTLDVHVATMDRMGVDLAVVSHMQTMSWEMAHANDEVLAAMRAYPGRMLGYISLWPCDAGTVQREMEQRLAQGFTGIKLHRANGFPYTDAAYAPAFALAHERRLPVLLHTWGDDGSFGEVRELSQRYPDAPILMAHAGVMAEAQYIAVAQECPNVYLDPTISRTPRGLWERLVAAVGAEKLTWGSDAVFYSMTPHLGKVGGANITEEAKRLILGGNARRILDRVEVVSTVV